MDKIAYSELLRLRDSLWNNTLSRENRYRLVDVIHFLLDHNNLVDYSL